MSSTPSPPPSQATPETVARMKDQNRDGRLRFKNWLEYQVRQDFKEEAMEKCKPQIKEFAECAQEYGLGVVFMCRSLNSKINECMQEHNSDEKFAQFLAQNPDALDKQANKKPELVSKTRLFK